MRKHRAQKNSAFPLWLIEIGLFVFILVPQAGVANRSLGVLEPAATLDLHLELIALSTGLQAIRGLGLFDGVTKKLHELTTLPHIFVIQSQ